MIVKKLKKNKYFKMGLTAFIVVILSMCFKYLLYNGSSLKKDISVAIKVLMPLIDGFVLAYLMNPIMRFFEKKVFVAYYKKFNKVINYKDKKRFRLLSIILTLLVVSFLLYAFFGTVLPEIYTSIESIINQFPTYYDNAYNWADNIIAHSDLFQEQKIDDLFYRYSEYIEEFTQTTILPNAKAFVVNMYSSVFNIVGALFDLIIGLIISIYLLSGKERFIGQGKKILYSYFEKNKVNNFLIDLRFVDKTFGGFLVGKIVDSIIIGLISVVTLHILDMPYPVLIAVIIGVTNIIPFFGPFIGAIPSALLILLVDPKKCIIFIIFVFVLQQLDGNVIGPAILGNSTGISGFWIIVAITVFGGIFGVVGMLIGVPVLAVLYALFKRNINNRLIKAGLPVATNKYADVEYINEDNEFIMLSDKKHKNNRYIELNGTEAEEENKFDNMKSFFKSIIAKVTGTVTSKKEEKNK